MVPPAQKKNAHFCYRDSGQVDSAAFAAGYEAWMQFLANAITGKLRNGRTHGNGALAREIAGGLDLPFWHPRF